MADIQEQQRFLDDLEVGESCVLGSRTFTQRDIIEFGERYDPQPFHTDPAAAARGSTGGLIASGFHTLAVAMSMIATSRPFGIFPVLGAGVDELRWPVPVRPDDTVKGGAVILELLTSATRADRGRVRLEVALRNQRDEVVLRMKPLIVLPRRTS